MSYFAEVVDGVVNNVIVADQNFIDSVEGNWVQTFEDASARYNYAVIGGIYDAIDDAFISPVPCAHTELILNELKRWECSNVEHQTKII